MVVQFCRVASLILKAGGTSLTSVSQLAFFSSTNMPMVAAVTAFVMEQTGNTVSSVTGRRFSESRKP